MTGASDGRDRERDIRREIENHLELEAEGLQQEGESNDHARRRARLAFGNPVVVQEAVRAIWVHTWLERLAYDVRYAVRIWAGTPGLSTVAILTIALGIGASTALVGQINAVFWTPLAVSQPEQLRQIAWSAARYPYVRGGALNVLPGADIDGTPTFSSVSYAAYEAMRNESTSFLDLACWGDFGEARPVTLGELGFGAVQFVSGNYFRTLGVGAAIGRTIQPEDDGPETWAPVAMVGYDFWQRVFGGDPAVTRQTLRLNGRTFAIVGVMPQTFSGFDPSTSADVVVPIGATSIAAQSANPLRNRGFWNVCRVVGRLHSGVSDDQARAEIERVLAASISTQPPVEPYDDPRIYLTDGAFGLGSLRQASSTPLAILLAGVGALLLAACANIAGLLLARGGARQREIATRLALGAPRRRLIRQLVTESLVLSSIGGVLGVALAFSLSDSASALLSQFIPTLFGSDRSLNLSTGPDLRVLGFAVVATLGSGLLFGISPAFRATRLDLISAIRQVRIGGDGRPSGKTGRLLVAAQTALAVVLLVSTGLFLQTLVNLRSTDLGFATDHLLYARVEPRSANLPQAQRAQFFEQAVNRLAQLPGVIAASAATPVPFGGDVTVGATPTVSVCLADGVARSRAWLAANISFIAPDYFATLEVDVLAGRDFTWADRPAGSHVPVIVNEALARQTFGLEETVGQSIRLAQNCQALASLGGQGLIVGVVRDIRNDNRAAAAPTVYWPLTVAAAPTTLLVRTSGDPAAMIATVRKAVTEINADIPTFSEAPVLVLRERALRRERLLSTLLGVFAIATMLVSALGIYGMLSYEVSKRRAEIGIRMAIGADARGVARLIIGDSLASVAGGVVAGLTAAFVVNRLLNAMFYGVTPGDPAVLVSAAGIFLLVAAAAVALPARAATRIDPVLSLRQ
jgi:predicted permease